MKIAVARPSGNAVQASIAASSVPENFDDQEASSFLLTPYRALAIAVRNEERAFAFFCCVASKSATSELQNFAEQMAKDELDHAGLLRRERRKAWRDEGRGSGATPHPTTVGELRAEAAAIEAAAATGHSALAATLSTEGDLAAANLFATVAAEEAAAAEQLQAAAAQPTPRTAAAPRSVIEGLRLLEYAFERYGDVAEHAADEAVMRDAQGLAERALRRLAYVRGSVDKTLVGRVVGAA